MAVKVCQTGILSGLKPPKTMLATDVALEPPPKEWLQIPKPITTHCFSQFVICNS